MAKEVISGAEALLRWNSEEYGLVLDQDAWAKACIDRINKDYEELKKKNGE